MSSLGIFIFGLVVTGLVATAVGLVVWGIIKENRDRTDPRQRKETFGAPAAATIASMEDGPRGE